MDEHDHRHKVLASAVRATGGMTLLSRFGGLIRDVVIARIFGATAIGSAFTAAFSLPNMFRRLFGEGALSAAFIPAYTEARRASPEEAGRLATLTVALLGLITGGLTVVIELVLLGLVLFTPADADRVLSLKLIMVMLPFMPLICVVAILAGVLQVHGRFGPAATGPLILNAFVIGVGVWCEVTHTLGGPLAAYALGVATVGSGVTQCIWFLRLLRGQVRWTRAWAAAWPRARVMLRKFVPVAVGLGTLQINTFMDMLITMWPIWVGPTVAGHAYPLDDKSTIILTLTQRLYQFPLGVFGIAVATAAFPLLSRYANEPVHFADTLRRGLRLSFFIGLPASVGLVLVRQDAVGVLFGHGGKGAWKPEELLRAASVLQGFAIAVWAYSFNHVFTRAFYARQDTTTPMRIAIAMVVLNFCLNITLMWWLREAGLAWATATSAIVQCGVLAWMVRKRIVPREDGIGRLIDADTLRGFGKTMLACAVMGVCVWGAMAAAKPMYAWLGSLWANPTWKNLLTTNTWTHQATHLLLLSGVGAVSYLGAAVALRVHELRWLLHRSRS